MNPVFNHENPKRVPAAGEMIGLFQRCAPVFLILIVEEAPTTDRIAFPIPRIPYLHLWRAPQVNAAVTLFEDFPINKHLEIPIVPFGLEAAPFPVKGNLSVDHFPVRRHVCVSLGLRGAVF